MILGQVAGEAVVLARSGGALFAIGAECTHYHGPLADGMLVADTVRCPWHHACFSLRTGEALRAPALNPVACWRVEQQDGKIYVREKLEPAERRARTVSGAGPESIVIIGGGLDRPIGAIHRAALDGSCRACVADQPLDHLADLFPASLRATTVPSCRMRTIVLSPWLAT
jgi:nitrite reductase/ring-hydroxylating ferredoxin subunit